MSAQNEGVLSKFAKRLGLVSNAGLKLKKRKSRLDDDIDAMSRGDAAPSRPDAFREPELAIKKRKK